MPPARVIWYGSSAVVVTFICVAVIAAPIGSISRSGAAVYRDNCASCHGYNLAGGVGPALSGPGFASRWRSKPDELQATIARSMPAAAPGSLTTRQYREVTVFVLSANGVLPAGAARHRGSSIDTTVGPSMPTVFPAPRQLFGTSATASPDDNELMHASDGNWLRYNRDYQGQRFSPLNQITPANAPSLVTKCIFQTGEIGNFQPSPIVRDGWMYITTAHRVYALDAANCHKRWSYEYKPVGAEGYLTNRGVALYKGEVIRGTTDGHLIALDAIKGNLLWDSWVGDSSKGYFISAVPVVFDGKIFVGEAGADLGASCHVYAFDAATGKRIWTFDLIPSGSQPGAESWGKDGMRSGGSIWTTITVEPATRRLYVSVGNPGPDFDERRRPGANLYTDAVVVLDADSGALQWYVQQVPHDVHDWDTAAAPLLYDLKGRRYLVVGSKDGRLYFYDRDTHQLMARRELSRRSNDMLPLPIDSAQGGDGLHVCPGVVGGVEWNGPAFDPSNGLVFVNSVDWCVTLTVEKTPNGSTIGGVPLIDPPEEARGSLRAFDAVTGEQKWVFMADASMLAGITPTSSGVLLTGTGNGDFLVFESNTGRELYRFYTGGAIAGGPSTYSVGGRQLIAVASGNASKSGWKVDGAATLIVFGLP